MRKNLLEKRIGFVGVGMMGDPMAQNLLKAGFKVMVYEIRPEATKNVVALGAKLAQKASELASCDIVFVMVNAGPQIEEVILGEQGIVKGLKREQLLVVVVMSTVSPILIRKVADLIGSKRIAIIDAPASGTPVAAQYGSLTFMVGGQEDIVASIKPYLQAMGENIFYMGPLGSGLVMKLVNNIISITNMYLFPEAMRIGLMAGLNINTMVEVFRVSTANNWFVSQWRTYVGFMDMLMKDRKLHENLNAISIKDIQCALELTEALGYESPMLKAIFPMIKSVALSTGTITEELFNQMVKAKIKT